MKLLQINTTVNSGSTGKIAENIGQIALSNGWESYIAYGRGKPQSASRLIRIGNNWDMRWHGLETRLLDNHGLASRRITRQFIHQIGKINPDIIHLHNIHGYFINYPLLFSFLREWGGPVVWTWHDIWPITGHCAFFGLEPCEKWKKGCINCERKKVYPSSIVLNRSAKNYNDKCISFTGIKNLIVVSASDWLNEMKHESFMHDSPSIVIHNGIDLNLFRPESMQHYNKSYILAVANVWTREKGWDDLMNLRTVLSEDIDIIMIGLSDKQLSGLPNCIKGIRRTESANELISLYSNALAFVNPTWGDNFPTTNIEALACGTPVITYNTGGSPETIDANTGIVVERGDIDGLAAAVMKITKDTDKYTSEQCRKRALTCFDKDICFKKYFDLYYSLLGQ